MPWPEPDPRDVKVSTTEWLGALLYRAILIALFVILLVALAYGLSLPD